MYYITDTELGDYEPLLERGDMTLEEWKETIFHYVDHGDHVEVKDISLPFVVITHNGEHWSKGVIHKEATFLQETANGRIFDLEKNIGTLEEPMNQWSWKIEFKDGAYTYIIREYRTSSNGTELWVKSGNWQKIAGSEFSIPVTNSLLYIVRYFEGN